VVACLIFSTFKILSIFLEEKIEGVGIQGTRAREIRQVFIGHVCCWEARSYSGSAGTPHWTLLLSTPPFLFLWLFPFIFSENFTLLVTLSGPRNNVRKTEPNFPMIDYLRGFSFFFSSLSVFHMCFCFVGRDEMGSRVWFFKGE